MREKSERIDVRVTPRLLRNVRKLRESGEFPDDSETVRFCIQFTLTLMRVLPAVLVESFAKTAESGLEEEDVTEMVVGEIASA